MPRGDAVQSRPTIEQEMATFKGFAVNDGETITDPAKEDLNPVKGKNTTDKEVAALAANATKTPTTKIEPVKLTDKEVEDAVAALDTELGHEATEEEIATRVQALTEEKNKTAAKPKKSVQDRINKATRERYKAERERDELKARIAALEAGKTPLTEKKPGDKADDDAAPDPTKFDYGALDAKYIRALARYEAKLELKEQAKNQQTEKLTAEQQKAFDKFQAQKSVFEEKGAELLDDFEEVVMQGARDKAWPLSDALGALLFESEFGPDIAYELASNPTLAKEVFGKSAGAQAVWLGKQEAKRESAGSGAKPKTAEELAAAEAAKTKTPAGDGKVTKAPTPIQRARGQGSNTSVPGDTNDFAAFEAAAMGRTRK